MKIARELELRLERLVDGISAALFRGRMHPVDLANRLIRFVDLSITEGGAGPEIPNQYVVAVNPDDLDATVDLDRLGTELANAVATTAAESGWRIGGPVAVRLETDNKVRQGSIRCDPASLPGALVPWAQLIGTAGGDALEIGDNRSIIGRGADADVQVTHERVSRKHALVVREAGSAWISDLGSANGTRVNDVAVAMKPVEFRAGDLLSLGPATFTLRLL
jgi:hypothetical protein